MVDLEEGYYIEPLYRERGMTQGDPLLTNIRGSSSHIKLNFKKYRLFVRLKFYHLKNIEQTDVDKSKRR